MLDEGARAAEREDLASPWRPVVSWSLGWGHYCAGDLAAAERWLTETVQLAPAAGQWVVGTGAIADLSLLAGFRGDRAEQLRLALEAVDQAQRTGLLEACEVGEVHTAYGCALLAHGRPGEALPELEQGVFLRRIWGQPLDLLDGLIALAPAVAALGDRTRAEALFREAEELAARCPDPGALPERLARRPPGRLARRGVRAAERARADGAAAAQRRDERARGRGGARRLVQHGALPRQGRVPQARRLLARRGPGARPPARAPPLGDPAAQVMTDHREARNRPG